VRRPYDRFPTPRFRPPPEPVREPPPVPEEPAWYRHGTGPEPVSEPQWFPFQNPREPVREPVPEGGAFLTAVAEILDTLRDRGFQLVAEPPNIHVKHPDRRELDRARALLDELRACKVEALKLLAEGETWDEGRERGRLDGAYDTCDEIAHTVPSWSDAWTWCRAERMDLVDEVDVAFDAIDDAFRAENTTASAEACRSLVAAVRAVADAYLQATGP